MRKNRMMRLASALLILTMVTTCAISGTFAKYVTQDSATDTARVAKWGVEVAVGGEFATATYAEEAGDSGTTVFSSTDVSLVAPGTNGTLCTSGITGMPEVAARVTRTATLTLGGWEVTGDWDGNGSVEDAEKDVEYCPIVFDVDGKKFEIGGTDKDGQAINTVDELAAAVAAALTSTTTHTPNSNLTETHEVTWSWAFTGNDDAKDTALGDVAAEDVTKAATIGFSYSVTVEQIN